MESSVYILEVVLSSHIYSKMVDLAARFFPFLWFIRRGEAGYSAESGSGFNIRLRSGLKAT